MKCVALSAASGVADGWQKCNCSSRGDPDGALPKCGNCMSTGACANGRCGGGCSFHDDNATGAPVVDVRRFPDMAALVKFGRGWARAAHLLHHHASCIAPLQGLYGEFR